MVIIAWVLYYLWTSFFPSLIWGSCGNEWNTESKFLLNLLSLLNIINFLDCYSTIQDLKCQEGNVGNAFDQIFYRGGCQTIESICASRNLTGMNVNSCIDQSTNKLLPINEVITRTLSAEEFY